MSKPITDFILSSETRVFLMCCDLRSFSAVAHALGIPQSAVSKIIRKFENAIGFELFIRNSRPLTLTPEAHLLHRQLRGLKGEMTRSLLYSLCRAKTTLSRFCASESWKACI